MTPPPNKMALIAAGSSSELAMEYITFSHDATLPLHSPKGGVLSV